MIVTGKDGQKFSVDEKHLTPFEAGQVRARILKSFRTEEGANTYLKVLGNRVEGAIIVKSLAGYDEFCAADGMVMEIPPSPPVHVVVEEDIGTVADVVTLKNTDELVRAMLKKGLLDTDGGGIYVTDKFYEILRSFTESAMKEFLKSVNPESEKAEDGTPFVDVITKFYEVSVKKAMSQEEASNLNGEERTESLGDQKGTAEKQIGERPKENGSPEGQALTQEEADNKEGDSRTDALGDKKGAAEDVLGGQVGTNEANAKTEDIGHAHEAPKTESISDQEANSKFGDVSKDIRKSLYVFKSFGEANAFSRRNPGYPFVTPTSIDEKREYGKRFQFAARSIEPNRR